MAELRAAVESGGWAPPDSAPAIRSERAPVLRLRGITKRFGSLVANDHISLDVARGEVLALLGENGAGKSTLVSILFGHYLADEGHIEVGSVPLPPGRPAAALKAGIGMVHQHFMLADNLSVLDNVLLGTEPLTAWRSKRAAARERLLHCSAEFGLPVDPDARVADLSVGERQRVEILKALVRDARILILDEPTAVLTPQESEALFATLGHLVAQGLSIVFISHKLDEVLRVSHRVAVLREGRLVAQVSSRETTAAELASWMVGREVPVARRRTTYGKAQGKVERETQAGEPAPQPAAWVSEATEDAAVAPVVCALIDVRAGSGRQRLQGVSLHVRVGEIVGIAGVSGNGQASLAGLLCGELAADAGQLQLNGKPLPAGVRGFTAAGVARVPEDRLSVGAIGDLSLWENAVLEAYPSRAFSRWGWLSRRRARAHAETIVQRLDVRGAVNGADTPARRLSGGNLQKLILGRALMRPDVAASGGGEGSVAAGAEAAPPRLIVVNQPTWGLDVGAVADVHQRLLDAASLGSAVIVISEDLDEVLALADRLAVMHQGHLTPAKPVAQWSRAEIGLAMAGQGSDMRPQPGSEVHDAAT